MVAQLALRGAGGGDKVDPASGELHTPFVCEGAAPTKLHRHAAAQLPLLVDVAGDKLDLAGDDSVEVDLAFAGCCISCD